ncbi:MAG: protein-disulfide reductase DsbD family protein [Hyphomicrobium sp.]|uniref:protein-disulfide reductase DsbD domain-containing protein n=1 Tax=Hyphomicrobium sp. TaxID=82 RepID=UPI0039E59C7A
MATDKVIRLALAFLMTGSAAAWSDAGPVASEWVQGMNNQVRLIAGHAARDGKTALYAGVDLSMPGGWKTYWRTPGDAGGVPPEFEWDGSENLASATVLYPAPHRIHDKAGDVVGYKNAVLFPVLLTPQDPAKPVTLHGKVAYGICKDICIPAEAELQLVIPPDVGTSGELMDALARVPEHKASDSASPSLAAWHLDQSSGKPKLVLDVAGADPTTADAFVEAPGGIYVPLPKRAADQAGNAVFEVDLTDGVNIKDIKGKPLTVTLIDGKGQSETTITLE